jgi:hypothetical protein
MSKRVLLTMPEMLGTLGPRGARASGVDNSALESVGSWGGSTE